VQVMDGVYGAGAPTLPQTGMDSPGSECALFSCETILAIVTMPDKAYRPPTYESQRRMERRIRYMCCRIGQYNDLTMLGTHTQGGARRPRLEHEA
jgi:hypothetical protein